MSARHILAEIRADDLAHDPWGTAMHWHFAIADLMAHGPLVRHYRNLRRGYGDGAYPDGQPMPARYAWGMAKASARGRELWADADYDHRGDLAWHVEIGAGIYVHVGAITDGQLCDCDEEHGPIPSHGHYGIVAEVFWFGRSIAYDAVWGFVRDWPGMDDDAELAHAWGEIAEPAIDHAREMYAAMPAWVLAQVEAWSE